MFDSDYYEGAERAICPHCLGECDILTREDSDDRRSWTLEESDCCGADATKETDNA